MDKILLKRTLKEILDPDRVEEDIGSGGEDSAPSDSEQAPNDEEEDGSMCVECQDMPVEVLCRDCEEQFCTVCFEMLHRSGRRRRHEFARKDDGTAAGAEAAAGAAAEESGADEEAAEAAEAAGAAAKPEETRADGRLLQLLQEHARYVPMRLTHEERHLLRLLEAALQVSEYTDRVDILSYKSRARRIVEQLKEMCSVLCGLVIASDLKAGQRLVEMKEFSEYAEWFQEVFEIGRRYKVMNPERMRDTFGKLCYMVMDSRLPQIQEHLEFHLYKPIRTVHAFLGDPRDGGKALRMLQDPLVLYATAHISPVGKTRAEINRLIRQKEHAIEQLAAKYSGDVYSKEDVRQALYSFGDYNAYVNMNRKPVMRMLERLELFRQPEVAKRFPLAIRQGRDGARLTHDHDKQWHYAQQSLSLWSVIQREMIRLWYVADQDLFDGAPYKLVSTGQGLNRVKASPSVYKAMMNILHECRTKCKGWVGSSVVHLGDDAVPNALFFLDKYTQVPNILIPFDQVLMHIKDLVRDDPAMLEYITTQYGSVEELQLVILQDAFAHMFDGSGADNFYMSGSCIDGRLTSAWNHTNEIAKKRYYNIFLMTGFIGFNGGEGF
ncbi:AFR050Wp [Eremothecium gossypii ATCC 10895]|uniref:AFR050Wp n=1 Tax=Eremothecium gossypii (strain ATCC 10895 / CBS 109.51 / FGSC 9923 / NRRL Y-1056) TaxID=284811 RepID=Q754M2_EREGS|nr:AFR050Wp [Eremothecium gossypii ATCC 10895]AAS53421.1 AFR050Wp [Eremothecium gossypii ATCC 10895]